MELGVVEDDRFFVWVVVEMVIEIPGGEGKVFLYGGKAGFLSFARIV